MTRDAIVVIIPMGARQLPSRINFFERDIVNLPGLQASSELSEIGKAFNLAPLALLNAPAPELPSLPSRLG